MPILITGLSSNSPNDARKKLRNKNGQLLPQSSSDDLLLPATKREERGEDTSQGYLCSLDGIREIFNMRMYKIPHEGRNPPTNRNSDHTRIKSANHVVKTKTILIGASYHVEEDSMTGKKKLRAKEILKKPPKPAASKEEAQKLADLALRLKHLKSNNFAERAHENLKQRIKESQARSWTICHGKRLVDGGREEKMQITPREVDDVVQRALMYVEEHDGRLVQELFHMEVELRYYIGRLKRALTNKKYTLNLSSSQQKLIQEHIIFGAKNIKPQNQAPIDGGILHLSNKPRRKPLKYKATTVTNYLATVGATNGGGAGGEKRLPLVDRLNKVQADMTAALLSQSPEKKRKNSVSFRYGNRSHQSSTSSMEPFSPRPPMGGLQPTNEDDEAPKSNCQRVPRRQSHRRLVQRNGGAADGCIDSRRISNASRRSSNASTSSVGATAQLNEGSVASIGPQAESSTQPEEESALCSHLQDQRIDGTLHVEVSVADNDDLIACGRRGRTSSMESTSTDVGPDSYDILTPVAPDAAQRPPFRSNRYKSISDRILKPTAPNKTAPTQRPKSEMIRARKLAMPARYEAADTSDPSARPHKLTSNDIKNANKIAEGQVALIRKQHADRKRLLNDMVKRASAVAARADEGGDKFVTSWEKQTDQLVKINRYFQFGLENKEKDWADDIKIKYDCFLTSGTDDKYGKLGVNFQVDMVSMRHRIKDKRFEIQCENLLKHKWFVILVVKLREKIETVFTPIPMSCFKFLLAVKEVVVLGSELTKSVFFTLVESTIEPDDHRDVVVHRTLKSIRDVLNIQADTFLEYLEKKEIQPSPELLSQVRSLRKKLVNQSKLAGFANTIKSGKASMLASKPRRWGNTGAVVVNSNSSPVSRSETPLAGEAFNENPETETIINAVSPSAKMEKQVTISVETIEEHDRRLTVAEKQGIFDDIAGGATELWRQKHALALRHDIASRDDRDSNIFATPVNSFEVFGDGETTSFDDLTDSGAFLSMDNLEEVDEDD